MDKIAEFVARDLPPLSVVDGNGFKPLVNYIETGYRVYIVETIYEINLLSVGYSNEFWVGYSDSANPYSLQLYFS